MKGLYERTIINDYIKDVELQENNNSNYKPDKCKPAKGDIKSVNHS